MPNIFFDEAFDTGAGLHHSFSWDRLGDIKEGRGDLGEEVPVLVYRLLQYSMNHVLAEEYGPERANELYRKAGHLAGGELARNVLDLSLPLDAFVAQLQEKLRELKVGVLRVESIDEDAGNIVLNVAQDLDCSGLPPTNEVVCSYDEGFLAGVLEAYTDKKFQVREIDCWASGDRVCRFQCSAGDSAHT